MSDVDAIRVTLEAPIVHEVKIETTREWVIEVYDRILAPAADHGDLTGLSHDDHPQYLLADGSRAADEIRLTPKTSSSGPEGTIFYASDDNHVYVGTE